MALFYVITEDTNYCNDGWELYTVTWQGTEHHSCFWFGGGREKVTMLFSLDERKRVIWSHILSAEGRMFEN